MTTPARIRILGVDDHPLLRQGIAAVINSQTDMEMVSQASTGTEALQKFRTCKPDITLMDLRLPDLSGIDAIIAIRSEFPAARIIVLTTFEGDVEVQRALEAGGQLMGLLGHSPLDWLRGSAKADAERIEQRITARAAARRQRRFGEADRIRAELATEGVLLEDRPDGSTTWWRKD